MGAPDQNQSQHLNEFLLVWNRLRMPSRLDGDSCGASQPRPNHSLTPFRRCRQGFVYQTGQNLREGKRDTKTAQHQKWIKSVFCAVLLLVASGWNTVMNFLKCLTCAANVSHHAGLQLMLRDYNDQQAFFSEPFAHLTFKGAFIRAGETMPLRSNSFPPSSSRSGIWTFFSPFWLRFTTVCSMIFFAWTP